MPTIEARITKVQKDESTGWFRISVDHGEIKRLDTKLEPKAREAVELMKSGSVAVIQFTQRDRTLDDGRVFQNYYYEQALAGGRNGSDEIEVITQTARKTEPGDAWRITLAASSKMAVAALPYLKEDGYDISVPSIQRLALEFANFLFFTPAPAGPSSQPEPAQQTSYDPGPGETRSFGDDDIPF